MKLASIELISEIQPHPNADKLELAKVLGYTCIIEKDRYRAGAAIVLIQPDTVLPNKPWAEMFKKRSSRVRAMKLRGSWSFGIVMSPYDVCDISDLKGMLMPINIGKDISERIGVIKYEAPQPQQLDAKGHLPFGLGKTDEERYQNILDLPFGETVDVSLKIDGCLKGDTLVYVKRGSVGGPHPRHGVIPLEGDNELVRIDKLVHENLVGVEVLTLDTNTGELEYQPILSTSVKDNEDKQWFEVELDDGAVITLTGNHKVWLPDLCCYRRTDELCEGDAVLVK